jgi:PAS domain-containing protein
MSAPTIENTLQLRLEAEARLKNGTAPSSGNCAIGVDALCLLHRLSSDPAMAGDALKLLHELQVHQVELDLQSRQLDSTESDLVADLARYRELFEFAPLAYFLVDDNNLILEGNRAATKLVGISRSALSGCRLDNVFDPHSVLALRRLLRQLANGSQTETAVLLVRNPHMASANEASYPMQVIASRAPVSHHILLTCTPTGAAVLV